MNKYETNNLNVRYRRLINKRSFILHYGNVALFLFLWVWNILVWIYFISSLDFTTFELSTFKYQWLDFFIFMAHIDKGRKYNLFQMFKVLVCFQLIKLTLFHKIASPYAIESFICLVPNLGTSKQNHQLENVAIASTTPKKINKVFSRKLLSW